MRRSNRNCNANQAWSAAAHSSVSPSGPQSSDAAPFPLEELQSRKTSFFKSHQNRNNDSGLQRDKSVKRRSSVLSNILRRRSTKKKLGTQNYKDWKEMNENAKAEPFRPWRLAKDKRVQQPKSLHKTGREKKEDSFRQAPRPPPPPNELSKVPKYENCFFARLTKIPLPKEEQIVLNKKGDSKDEQRSHQISAFFKSQPSLPALGYKNQPKGDHRKSQIVDVATNWIQTL